MTRIAQTVERSAKNRRVARSEDPVLTSMGALLYGP
jgi:hypothetical protein